MPIVPPRPRKPGAGLGFLFPESEAPTGKLPVVPEVRAHEMLCPMCGGAQQFHIGPYQRETCPTCGGAGVVTPEVFDKFIADHPHSLAARQLARKKKT